MTTQIYFNYEDPQVERLARAIVVKRGYDPDELVQDSGYPDSVKIPAWWKYQDYALSFIAMTEEIAK